VPTFNDFPLGVTRGTYDRTFNTLDAATYNPSFVTANGGTPATAEARLAECLAAGRAYMNVHSSSFPGGEIRGFLESRNQAPEKPAIPVRFGLPGEAIDPPAAAGGSTRDRVEPPVIIIGSGDTINYVNIGPPHRVAIYDKDLAKNGTTPPTTFADINTAAGTGLFLDDPIGRLTVGDPGASISWTFTNTTGAVEQYLVICAFRPHFVDYGMSQIVLVTP
jgi:plastocyanin